MTENPRLSPAQQQLLDEIRATGLYIKRNTRYERTVLALERKGLVRLDSPDYSKLAMDHWVAA